jgi:hypothetical protein
MSIKCANKFTVPQLSMAGWPDGVAVVREGLRGRADGRGAMTVVA